MTRKGKQRRPLLCGYYGEHNLGDDALLAVLLSQLPGSLEPLVTAQDQNWVNERFGVRTCDRRRFQEVIRALWFCDALVLGGGSLLQDATSFKSLLYYGLLIIAARVQFKAVLLWGQGLGPLRRPISRVVVRLVLPFVTTVTWRDEESGQLAKRLGRRRQSVGSDPVWAYPLQETWQGPGGPIVLCWRPVRSLETNGWIPYLSALATLVETSGRSVVWLPFHEGQDLGLLQLLHQADLIPRSVAARSREVAVEDPSEAVACFAQAGLVLAMRLHGLILAALTGSPVAALSYDPKVEAAARAIGCPVQDLKASADPGLADQWERQLDQPPAREKIEALKAGTAVHERVLREVLRLN